MSDAPEDDKPALPPIGLIADELIREPKKVEPAPVKVEKPPVFPGVDPDYKEPMTVADFKQLLVDGGQNVTAHVDTINKLIARVELLEGTLMPFGRHAAMLANVEMCFRASGRGGEPVGGTWMNGVSNSQLQANANVFYDAADAIGRAKVEQSIADIFNRIQEANKAVAERDAHVEDARLAGPTGGPVTGRIH